MPLTDDEEREAHQLRMELMRADIENKRADSEYKRGLLRFEPWKIAFTAVAAGAAVATALIALGSWLAR